MWCCAAAAIIPYMVLGTVLMVPLHLLNLMGNNQNFFNGKPIWREQNDVAAKPVLPVNRLGAIPFPAGLKLVTAFWLFALGYFLSSGTSQTFIYFQF